MTMIMITLMIDEQDDYKDHNDLDKHLILQPIDLRAVAQTCSRLSEVTIFMKISLSPLSSFSRPHLCMMWTKSDEKKKNSSDCHNPSSPAGVRVPLPHTRLCCSSLGTASRCRAEEDALQLG